MQKAIKPIGDDKRTKYPLVNQHPEHSKYQAVWKFLQKEKEKCYEKNYFRRAS